MQTASSNRECGTICWRCLDISAKLCHTEFVKRYSGEKGVFELKAVLSFFFYGLWGEQIYELFIEDWDVKPLIFLLAVSGIVHIVTNILEKKKHATAFLGVWLGYIILVGLGQIFMVFLFLGVLNLLFQILTGGIWDSPQKPRTPEQQKQDRKDALRSVVYQANDLVDYLDDDSRRRYEAEFNSLLWNEKTTEADIRRMQNRWSYYYSNPQVGSKRYRELHRDD